LRSALTVATDAGDLVLGGSPEETVSDLVSDYCRAIEAGDEAIMLAPRRAEVRMLNDLAREQLVVDGRIRGPSIDVGGRPFASGDRVVLRRNASDLAVQNGTRGVVASVDAQSQALTIELQDGSLRRLPSRYLHLRTRRGGPAVEHGFALTAHLAQGMTTDRAFVLGSEAVYREWGYVAWSRARLGTRFYAVEPELSEEHHTGAPVEVDRFEELVRRLDRSEAQRVASDALPGAASERRAGAGKHGRITYLEQALGERPDSFRRRRRWDRAARRIERYRARHGITDSTNPLGPEPTERAEQIAWRRAHGDLARSQLELGRRAASDRRSRAVEL
jgi:hypothetical protein